MERKLPEKNFLVGYRFSSFLEILENAVPFATGSCRKFKPDVLVEWKVPIDFSNLCRSQRDNFHDLCPIALWRKHNSS